MDQININNEVIKVENIAKENQLWLWITRVGGLLGVLLTAFVLLQLVISKPNISAKIVSFTGDGLKPIQYLDFSGNRIEFDGYKFLTKVAITVTDEDLYYDDIKVIVNYRNGFTQKATLFNPNERFKNWNYGEKKWQFKSVPENQLMLFTPALESRKTHYRYLAFLVKKSDSIPLYRTGSSERPESVELVFTNTHKNIFLKKVNSNISLSWDNLESIQRVYEENLWEDESVSAINTENFIKSELRKPSVNSKINSFLITQDASGLFEYLPGFIKYVHKELNKKEN